MTARTQVTLPDFDINRLIPLIPGRDLGEEGDENEERSSLGEKLARAAVVPQRQIPADVVTLNSTVRVKDVNSNEAQDLTLVLPHCVDMGDDCVSVLSPVGAELLGARVGEVVHCLTPSGGRSLRVVELLYQPESAGEYDR